jgi:serine/threonine-protein kinase
LARGSKYEVVGRLPPGEGGKTSLAVVGGHGGFKRLCVMRPIGESTLVPVANIDPQLLSPLAIDDVEGTAFAVYDFHPGATLKEIVAIYRTQEQLPPLGLAVRLVVDAARTMTFAHEHQDALGGPGCFVHGALSDATLLLGFDGLVRVLDFGVRSVNRFSSPEAVRGGPLDPRSDIFSLAASLHSALTGFEGSYAQVLQTTPAATDFPPPTAVHPDATPELDALMMKALMPARDGRLSSAAKLADELERIAGTALPQPQACATRIRQLFEERLDGLRNMVPRLESDVGAPRPRPSAPRAPVPVSKRPTGARPALSEAEAAPAPPPPRTSGQHAKHVPEESAAPAPRVSGSHAKHVPSEGAAAAAPRVSGSHAKHVPSEGAAAASPRVSGSHAKHVPAEGGAASPRVSGSHAKHTPAGNGAPPPPSDSAFEGEDEETIIKEDRKAAGAVAADLVEQDEHDATVVQDIDPKHLKEARRSGEVPRLDKKAQKETQPRGDVPWQTQDPDSPPGQPAEEGLSLADGGNVPTGADFVPPSGVAEVPEHTPAHPGPVPIEDVPTGVAKRVTGAHEAFNPSGTSDEERAAAVGQELVSTGDVDPEDADDLRKQPTDIRRSNGAGLQKEAAAAFEPMGHDQATVVRGGGVNSEPPPEVNTGVLGPPELPSEVKRKRKGSGARKMIAFLLLAMASGFGYVALKNPVMVRAKINEALVKWKLKKPAPPPTDQPPGQVEDGQPPGQGAAVAAADVGDGGEEDEYSDGGDDEEDEVVDAGPSVAHGDAGVGARDAGAGAQAPPKKKKHKHVRPWWQTH